MMWKLKHTLLVGIILFGATHTGMADIPPPRKDPSPSAAKDQESDARAVIEANNRFALDLYERLAKDPALKNEGPNLFFSPYSLSAALAMSWAGARGTTEKQMAEVLRFTLSQKRLHQAFAQWQKGMTAGNSDGYQLSVANALWAQEGLKLLNSFIGLIGANYDGGLKTLDFKRALEETRTTINAWVESKTSGKIVELIKPGDVEATTALVLTNALYFKGSWASKFDAARTRPWPFKVSPDEEVQVPMMFQMGFFEYAEKDGLQILRLPYGDGKLSMVVLLPRETDGLEALENNLSTATLKSWMDGLREEQLTAGIPRFTMTSHVYLEKVLAAMGMPDAFSPGRADFSGITGSKDLFISKVIHEAFVEVNEEGTEAAAATGIAMKKGGAIFRADHPFLFVIRDDRTGGLLFMGRLMNPAE